MVTKNNFKFVLNPLSKRIKHISYVGFDVETHGKENTFYSGGLYYNWKGKEFFKYFTDKEEMIKFMLARKFRNRQIVATNLDFDFCALFYNTKYWNKFKILMRDGKIILASYDLGNNNGKIKFVDTMNYVFYSVAKLGEIVGIKKLDKPSFLGKIPVDEQERLELMIYNQEDCKISYAFMNFFQEGVNSIGGTLKLTIGSTTMSIWRMNYQPQTIYKEEYVLGNKDVREFIFEGYYGGRTEVFKRGHFDKVNYYDVNSLYPFSMKNDFPLPQSVKDVDKDSISINNIMFYEGVSRCNVKIEKMNKPILPLRHNGKLIFPVGKFTGTWNHPELREAIKNGYEVEPIKQIIYTKTFRPFDDFVDDLYALRLKYKEENPPMEFLVKLLLNSLYGKFGMKKVQTYKVLDADNLTYKEFMKQTKDTDFDIKGNKIICSYEKKFNPNYSIPILASYVTSYARVHMYQYLVDPNVIYTDTDSVITSSEFNSTSKALGDMKLEGVFEDNTFVKPKFYKLGDIVRIKGVSRANPNDFKAFMNHEKVIKTKFTRLKESVRRGMLPNTIIEVPKSLSLTDDKRVYEHQDLKIVANSEPVEVDL